MPTSPPPPPDVTCLPAEEASAPAALPASPTERLEAGLSSAFSDLLGPLGAQADGAGCSTQPSPKREPAAVASGAEARLTLGLHAAPPATHRSLHPERAQRPGGQWPALEAVG